MDTLTVLSLGAGVQSSTVLLMSATGDLPRVDAAVFADTQAEPKAVYDWLDWLEREVAGVIPVYRVTAGDLAYGALHPAKKYSGHIGQPPFYVKDPPDDYRVQQREGRLWRKCTSDYKLVPLRREVRRLMTEAGAKHVDQWIGISLDEAHRMKDSGVRFVTNCYPLIDRRMTRHDCLRWMQAHGYPEPPKSACVFCPYTNNARWRHLRDTAPQDWQRAVDFDARLRTVQMPGVRGTAYVHRTLIPLSQVDLSTAADYGQRELDLWGNECEGMCGV